MALPYEISLAHRELARHPSLTAAMVVGLALAVLVMVYIPSNMVSFYADMIDRIVEQNSPHITVWPVERQSGRIEAVMRSEAGAGTLMAFADRTNPRVRDINGYHALARQVSAVAGVTHVANLVRGNATVTRGRVNLGVEMEGIEPKQFARVVNIAKHFPGNQPPELSPMDIAIGFRAAEKLGVHIGEHVHVSTAQSQLSMRVKAIFRSGYYQKDLNHVYVALSTAQRLFHMGNEVSALSVRCTSVEQAEEVSNVLRQRTRRKIRNWRDDNASLLAEVSLVKRITTFISILVALVASVGMGNVFSVFVMNRQKELAILRAVGASRVSLRAILLLEAMFIWLIGTIVGVTAVLAVMAYEQAYPHQVSAETYGIESFATEPQLTVLVFASLLAGATMAGSAWWSGRKVAKLNPIEVIFGR